MSNWLTRTVQRVFSAHRNLVTRSDSSSSAVLGSLEQEFSCNVPKRFCLSAARFDPSIVSRVYEALVGYEAEVNEYLEKLHGEDYQKTGFLSVWPEVETALFIQDLQNGSGAFLAFEFVSLQTTTESRVILRTTGNSADIATYHCMQVTPAEVDEIGDLTFLTMQKSIRQLYDNAGYTCNYSSWLRSFVLDDVVETLRFWHGYDGDASTLPLDKLQASEHYVQKYLARAEQYLNESILPKVPEAKKFTLNENITNPLSDVFSKLLNEKYSGKLFLALGYADPHNDEDSKFFISFQLFIARDGKYQNVFDVLNVFHNFKVPKDTVLH